jgi:hypothetical protein
LSTRTTKRQTISAKTLTIEDAKALQAPKKVENLFELMAQSSNQIGARATRYLIRGLFMTEGYCLPLALNAFDPASVNLGDEVQIHTRNPYTTDLRQYECCCG